jgi:glycosyltransferase involved in cell wall biosynthesis
LERTNILRALIEAVRVLRGWRPRRVHAFGFPVIYYGTIASAWARVPVLITALQDRDVWKKWKDRLFDRLCRPMIDLYIADGVGTAEFAARTFGYPRNRIRVIYDGPEIVPHRDSDPAPRSIVFAVVARIDIKKKGQDDFLRAIALLGEEGKRAKYRIVGSGPPAQEARLRTLATELEIADRIEWVPEQVDLDAVYRSLDVLVVPSRWESVPKVVIEAMAWGKPVVAARVGDISEVLDESCGILVEPGSPSALAGALQSLIRDPEKVPRFGAAAAERLASLGITFENTIAELRRAYSELERTNHSHLLRLLATMLATSVLLARVTVSSLRRLLVAIGSAPLKIVRIVRAGKRSTPRR